MPFRVVLTGGIASGKTTVANEFAALGVPVIDTDQISRDVVAAGTPALAEIVAAFGADVLDATGCLDRRRMRERIFSDPEARRQLEAIMHPAIRMELTRRSQAAGGAYQIHAIPLFVEKGAQGDYDRVLVVDCPEEAQLTRLVARDHVSLEQARQTLAAQATREQRSAIATDVIANIGTLAELRSSVRALHERFLQASHTSHSGAAPAQ